MNKVLLAIDAVFTTLDASLVSKISATQANVLLLISGPSGLFIWFEGGAKLFGLLAAFFTCLGAIAGCAYWAIKAYIAYKHRNDSNPNL